MKITNYSKKNHINNLILKPFYKNLIILRSIIELTCDEYFKEINAPKVDLFMLAKGISSPIGKGSDSLPIPIKLGNNNVFLVDSSQFGMEPLVQKSFDTVYCYLPSFRGEDADDRHLNQFYHCEAETRGDIRKIMNIAEELIKKITVNAVLSYESGIIQFKKNNFANISEIINKPFPVITFDEAEKLLNKHGTSYFIEKRAYGRVFTNAGERKIGELVGKGINPVWVTHYDRDVVPFYQKPDKNNPERVLNADLIFPSINGGFGGEIIGSGQRQDNPKEILKSMKRQKVHNESQYDWYINLRKRPNYQTTSGFGMGIERFVSWCLGLSSIIDAAIYPVIKNEDMHV